MISFENKILRIMYGGYITLFNDINIIYQNIVTPEKIITTSLLFII